MGSVSCGRHCRSGRRRDWEKMVICPYRSSRQAAPNRPPVAIHRIMPALSFREWLGNRDGDVPAAEKLATLVSQTAAGVSRDDLAGALRLPPRVLDDLLRALTATGQVVMLKVGGDVPVAVRQPVVEGPHGICTRPAVDSAFPSLFYERWKRLAATWLSMWRPPNCPKGTGDPAVP